MKIAKLMITRGEIDKLIHELKSLGKLYDNPAVKSRFVASNFLEAKIDAGPLGKLFKKDARLRIILAMDRWGGKDVGKTKDLPKVSKPD